MRIMFTVTNFLTHQWSLCQGHFHSYDIALLARMHTGTRTHFCDALAVA